MKSAAVVVSHGGHGTVIRALANGCPLLVQPMGRDQNDNAARVVARGAGLSLPPDAAVEDIRAALERLLRERPFTERAAVLGDAIRAEADASPILVLLEALGSRARPACCAA
jgi:UDP:flavonoid glycosyltransferase YjiC (YdhE family)